MNDIRKRMNRIKQKKSNSKFKYLEFEYSNND